MKQGMPEKEASERNAGAAAREKYSLRKESEETFFEGGKVDKNIRGYTLLWKKIIIGGSNEAKKKNNSSLTVSIYDICDIIGKPSLPLQETAEQPQIRALYAP